MRRFFAAIVFLLVLTSCTIMFLPAKVSSNPIAITQHNFDSGGIFMGDNVSMPESEVNIVLDPFDTKIFELRSVFTLTSVINQSLLTAFAYPFEWSYISDDHAVMDCEFEIEQNQEQIDFVTLTFEQVVTTYNATTGNVTYSDIAEWGWMEDHHFAAFNLSFVENSPIMLEVKGSSSLGITGNYEFRYCVGSAYSWHGVTHEIITIDVKGMENRSVRYGDDIYVHEFAGFFPEIGLTTTQNQTWKSAVWDLTIQGDDFEITHVGFGGQSYSYWDPLMIQIQELALIIIPVTGVIIGGIYFAKRRGAI
ncbi:MAG: hypothetical protein KGD60_12990 [Candidatus Thorarchaeota archaeon]|nr:hypothetical protein [Candidatus Thorarchaeota archaeon]